MVLVVLVYPFVILVFLLVGLVCPLVVLVSPFVCPFVVLICLLVISVCSLVVLVVLSASLFITDLEIQYVHAPGMFVLSLFFFSFALLKSLINFILQKFYFE